MNGVSDVFWMGMHMMDDLAKAFSDHVDLGRTTFGCPGYFELV